MKKRLLISLFALALLASCKPDKEVLNDLADYNTSMETKGYRFGDKIVLPKEVTDMAESVSISFGDKETTSLTVDPKFFALGDNAVTFNIKKKNGEVLQQDATINVFAKNPEAVINYEIVKEYPHDSSHFTEGFFLEGNTVYESVGQQGQSKLVKYNLGSTTPILETKQADEIFSEGIAAIGNKIYQLTYQNKKIFVYDKSSFKLLQEFPSPNVMGEGWGMTTDGKYLIADDGTKNIYFLDPNNPSKMVKYISVAGYKEVFDQINELELHKGFLYANVWHKPIILKINPNTGEVVGKFDFTEITKKYTDVDTEHTLNGIAFKGDNLLITGKNWDKIYEVAVK